ncbi:MAG: DUF1801 domain-containing protein [Caulobacter sp.]|nr:DUF1801 domain-containing protein [Caulobacter sp.]
MTAPAFTDPAVEAVFAAYPAPLRERLLDLRALIFETATGPLSESLKWGQPAYRPTGAKAGTTVRIDALKGSADGYALYFHCQTTLVPSFRNLYSDTLRFEGDRAILLSLAEPPPREALAFCIGQALTYRGRR